MWIYDCGVSIKVRCFGGGGVTLTPPPQPKPAPTVDDAAENAAKEDELKRRKGRRSTMVTGPLGVSETPLLAYKTLLGE